MPHPPHAHDDHPQGSYYVPEYSWLPVLTAASLFLLGLGSVNYFGPDSQNGLKLLAVGFGLLTLIIITWLTAVIRENRRGLYDAQMNRTFLWGMGWFMFSDFMLFAGLLGTLFYLRVFTFPQLAGSPHAFESVTHYLLWPDFKDQWPVLANPDTLQFKAPAQGLSFGFHNILTTLIMLASAITLAFANFGLKTRRKILLNSGLITTFLLICLFLILKTEAVYMAITHFGLTLESGIYGSITLFSLAIFLLHVIVAGLLLLSIMIRAFLNHFSLQNNFSIQAFCWFWHFLVMIWVILFFALY